jgi:hypothetical protein
LLYELLSSHLHLKYFLNNASLRLLTSADHAEGPCRENLLTKRGSQTHLSASVHIPWKNSRVLCHRWWQPVGWFNGLPAISEVKVNN